MKLVREMLVALPAVLAVGGIGDGSRAPPAAVAGTTAEASIGCDPVLAEALLAWAHAGFSGSIAISTGGEFDCLAAYGMANAATEAPNSVDTVFSIGSVSKAFTAAAFFRLVDAGELTLTDRAGALIQDLAGPGADATVEQLLLHTSGLIGSHGSDHEPLGRDEALAAIGDLEQEFEPGSQFLYSNAGTRCLRSSSRRFPARATGSTCPRCCVSRAATSPAGSGTASRAPQAMAACSRSPSAAERAVPSVLDLGFAHLST